jgi:ABC-type Fe3+-hydroxamate transport system substrate-binding protein
LPAVTNGRLPAYSGATVPVFDRLPARKRERHNLPHAGLRSWFCENGAAMKRLAVVLLLLVCGCANRGTHAAPMNASRIVALIPAFAQDLCAIGAGRTLIAVSAYTNAACAAKLPVVSDFASVDTEKIVALHADAVVAIPAQRRLTAPLERIGVPVVYLSDDSYSDLLRNIDAIGRISGHDAQARSLVAQLELRTAQLRASEHFRKRPRVFVVIQGLPIWTAGPNSYIATLIDFAGGRDAATSLRIPYAQYNPEALLRLQPDAVIASTDTRLDLLLAREPWRSLRAVRNHHVFVYPTALLNLPGPQYNEGISWLIERLRPLAK